MERKPRLIICCGLPGSGKSTWARAHAHESDGAAIRVNRDDIRISIHGGAPWSRRREVASVAVRNGMIRAGLEAGLDVISDDTNLPIATRLVLEDLAVGCGASVEYKSFLDVSMEECIRRNAERDPTEQVDESVIRQMAREHLGVGA